MSDARVEADARHNPLPRELAPGVTWIGSCQRQVTAERLLHTYNSCYLVSGERESMLVETGCAQELPITIAQLEGLLAAGAPPLRWIFCTHQETPHSAGIGWLCERYPDVRVVGSRTGFGLPPTPSTRIASWQCRSERRSTSAARRCGSARR